MIFVTKLNAPVSRSEHLHAPRNLGSEIELSGAEHPLVEVQKAPAAREKWLDSAMVKEIDLCTDGTAASSMSIRALAIRLRITHYRKWDHFGNIAQGQQVIRVDESAITGFDLVHATIGRASEGVAVSELPFKPESEFIPWALVLRAGDANKKRCCTQYPQDQGDPSRQPEPSSLLRLHCSQQATGSSPIDFIRSGMAENSRCDSGETAANNSLCKYHY